MYSLNREPAWVAKSSKAPQFDVQLCPLGVLDTFGRGFDSQIGSDYVSWFVRTILKLVRFTIMANDKQPEVDDP